MTEVSALLLWLLAAPPAVALTIFLAETVCGLPRRKAVERVGDVPSTVILVPAHDEENGIVATLDRLAAALPAEARVLVVADNCTDDTARLARAAGHEVIERFDPTNRGKGFALAFGRDHLGAAPPRCVIVFDADCMTDTASIAALARHAVRREAVVQARYVFRPDAAAPAKVQISNFAFWIKNVVRQRGGARLGGPAVLVGSGMAFPWALFEAAPLATASIVEDLAMSVHLTQSGHPPVYLDEALIESAAASETATLGQRRRWEAGFLAVAGSVAPRALSRGLITADRKLFQLGLHLLVPPLALLLSISLVALMLVGAGGAVTGYWYPCFLLAALLGGVTCAILAAWTLEGHRWLSGGALLRIPLYMAWKVPIYLGIVRKDAVGWSRTERVDK